MFLLVLSCFFRRRKQIASPFIPCLPCSDKIFAQSIFAKSTKVRHLLNKIKILSLCLPLMGFAYGKSQLMRVLIFSDKPFLRLPKKMSLTQREPLRKDKIRGQNSSLRS